MSFDHLRQAFALDLPRREHYILLVMANCTDRESGVCKVSYAYLAKKTKYHKSQVRQGVSELLNWGHMVVIELNKRNQPKSYLMTMPPVDAEDDSDGCALSTPINGNECALYTPKADDEGALSAPKADDECALNAPATGNGCALCSDGCALCAPDPVLYPGDLKIPPVAPPKGEEREGQAQYPQDFEYYFESVYPNPTGMWAAYEIFRTLSLSQAELEHMREVILWRRAHDPKWRPDDKGKKFILSPAKFLRKREYLDKIPGRSSPPPCEHSPDRVAQSAGGRWFCACDQELSPAEAEALGLTAEARNMAFNELEAIQHQLHHPKAK